MEAKDRFIDWMKENRGKIQNSSASAGTGSRSFWGTMTFGGARQARPSTHPREEFVTAQNISRAYEWHYLPIGYGVTITGPHTVARMTNSLNVKFEDKVLEIGTGSGYQSAYLSNLTEKVFSIEIIKPLAERTSALYDSLIARGYGEYKAIAKKHADGYYGWEEEAPFDKIIVTCGIDHIPPPLLQQLKPGNHGNSRRTPWLTARPQDQQAASL